MQLTYLALLNVAIIFWSLAFPFHFRKIRVAGMTRIHIAIVVTALLLPLPLTLVHLKDGFVGIQQPTTLCFGRDTDSIYYFFTLPESVMLSATNILLILVFWKIFKVYSKTTHRLTCEKPVQICTYLIKCRCIPKEIHCSQQCGHYNRPLQLASIYS